MKRTLLMLLGLCSLGTARAEIIFRAEPPQVPDKAPMAAVSRWPMSFATFQKRAMELGVRGEIQRAPRGLVMNSSPLLFHQDMMGSEFFANTERYMAEPPGELPPLSDDDAQKRALEFLRKNPGRLSLNFAEVKPLRVAHLMNQAQDVLKGELTPATQDESIVIFQRFIEGIPVIPAEGPGDHIRVHIANTGDIVGQHQLWRNARAFDALATRPYEDAQKELVERLTKELGDNQLYDALIEKIEFGLYSRPEGQVQEFLQPAYLFHIVLFNKEEKQSTGARRMAIAGVDPRALKEPLDLPLPPPETGNRDKIVFKAEPPQLPTSLPAVQLVPIKLSEDTVQRRALSLGLADGKLIQTPRGLGVSNDKLLLFQDPNGTELFGDMTRMMAEKPGEAPPIADREAIAIAMEQIKALGDMDEAELGTPIVRRLHQQAFDTEGQKPGAETIDEAIVEFPRQIPIAGAAPIPCVGPGAFLKIHVDNFGKPTGHHRMWRQLNMQALEPMRLRPVAQIQEEGIRQILSELGTSIGMVTEIKAGLYMRGEGMDQGFAQPALLYEVDLVDEATGEVTGHRQIPIPAADTILEPLEDPDAQLGVTDPALQTARGSDTIPQLFGDMDNNGELELVDVVLCIQFAGGLAELDNLAQLAAGDVNPTGAAMGDGSVRLDDALRVLRGVLGIEDLNPAM